MQELRAMPNRVGAKGSSRPPPDGTGRQYLESMVAIRGSSVESPTRAHPASRTDVEFDDADWDLDESGIAEVPSLLEQEPGPELVRRELELARSEIARLQGTVRELKQERDQALRTALNVRRELTEELGSARRQAKEARLLAEQEERSRRTIQQRAMARLTRFEQRIQAMRDQLIGFQTMLSAVGHPRRARAAGSKR
jgi:hypothetical protein